MLPEYEVELLTATLAEWRRQIEADTAAMQAHQHVGDSMSLLERLYCLLTLDAAHVPAVEKPALPMESQPLH